MEEFEGKRRGLFIEDLTAFLIPIVQAIAKNIKSKEFAAGRLPIDIFFQSRSDDEDYPRIITLDNEDYPRIITLDNEDYP